MDRIKIAAKLCNPSFCGSTKEGTMITCTTDEIVEVTRAYVCSHAEVTSISSVTIDSRTVAPQGMFVAFRGEKTDGNLYAASAIRTGAACVVLTSEAPEELVDLASEHSCLLLRAAYDDAQEFLLDLATFWRDQNTSWVVVGVTGSCGKTTTKDMLITALSTTFRTYGTKGNLNNLIGLPLTILNVPSDAEVIVAEMGMNHQGEIARMSFVAKPTISIITNIGTSHLGLLGSRKAIAEAKAEIIGPMCPQRSRRLRPELILHDMDDFTQFISEAYAQPADVAVSLVGETSDSAINIMYVDLDEVGKASTSLICSDGCVRDLTLPEAGRASVMDAAFTLRVCEILGVSYDKAIAALENMQQVHMRMEEIKKPHTPLIIDDSYNAAPASIAQALKTLEHCECAGRRIAMLGEVGELGVHARRLHGYIGAYVAACKVDLIIFVGGENAREMREAASTMGYPALHMIYVKDVDEALKEVKPLLTEDDVILVKASRSAQLDKFVKGVSASC